MKKLTNRQKKWQVLRARNQHKRLFRPPGQLASISIGYGRALVFLKNGTQVPAHLDLESNASDTISFIHNLRVRSLRKTTGEILSRTSKRTGKISRLRNYADFTTLESISPGAALMLAAEYDRMYRNQGLGPRPIDIHKWNNNVYASLYELGFFDLLSFNPVQLKDGALPLPERTDQTRLMRMSSGTRTNAEPLEDGIIELFASVGGDATLRVQLVGAIIDAMENVREHAYKGREGRDLRLVPPRWWVSGAANSETRELSLLIYDQGATIPFTLPRVWGQTVVNQTISKLKGVLQRLNIGIGPDASQQESDCASMIAAMRLSQTSSGESHRGKGLAKIGEVIKRCEGGRLLAISRHAFYEAVDGSESCRAIDVPLLGTYIELKATF